MEKATDLESQIPVPEVQEAPKERNVFHVILAKIKKVLDIVFGRKLTKRHVPLLIYVVWFFLLQYIYLHGFLWDTRLLQRIEVQLLTNGDNEKRRNCHGARHGEFNRKTFQLFSR